MNALRSARSETLRSWRAASRTFDDYAKTKSALATAALEKISDLFAIKREIKG
jgi:hypothetical protein